jgi:hypothetical protein
MKAGDLVYAVYDLQRRLGCVGIVLEAKMGEAKVMWSSPSNPIGWWQEHQLEVIGEGRKSSLKRSGSKS